MSTTELRKNAKKNIDRIKGDKLKTATLFLDFLANQDEPLLRSRPPIAERLKQAERDIAAGRVISLEKLRRKYPRV